MKIGAIILNYNDTSRCVIQADRLVSYYLFNEIVIVDNNSNQLEKNQLKKYNSKNVKVIFSETNNGYGSGNNKGLKYLKSKNFDFVLLINSDTIMKKESIEQMYKFMINNNRCAAITCPMIERGKLKRNFYDFPNLQNSFFDCVTIESNSKVDLEKNKYSLSELNSIFTKLSKKCHSMKIKGNYLTSDFIRESCTIYNLKHFEKINYFDEDFFMYEEGPSICMNFKKNNLYVGLLMDAPPCIHDHKGTFFNRKTFAAIKKSRIHFFKKYLKYPWYKTILIKIFYINVYLK